MTKPTTINKLIHSMAFNCYVVCFSQTCALELFNLAKKLGGKKE